MIKIQIDKKELQIYKDSKLTSGSVGLKALFNFSNDWSGLNKKAVYRARDKFGKTAELKTIYLGSTNSMEAIVAWEVLSKKYIGWDIQIGVCGYNGNTIVYPTMYASLGTLIEGADSEGEPSTEHTPLLVEQLIELAQSVRDDADAGKFNGQDGFSPSAKVEEQPAGALLTVTDRNGTTQAFIKNGTGGEGSGISPTANVTQTDTGATITITDATGTTTADITNGKDGANGTDGKNGTDGADGFSPSATVTQTETGADITITDKSGTSTADITNGTDGRTPVKGVDYYTDADKAEMQAEVLEQTYTKQVSDERYASSVVEHLEGDVIADDIATRFVHNVPCRVLSTNLFNINAISNPDIQVTGNTVSFTGAGNINLMVPLIGLCPNIKADQMYTISAITSEGAPQYIYLVGSRRVWRYGESVKITTEDIGGDVYLYGAQTGETTISNIKIEKGITATEYTPYITALSDVTVTRNSRNRLNPQVLTGQGFTDLGGGEYYVESPATVYEKNIIEGINAGDNTLYISFWIRWENTQNDYSGISLTVHYTDGTKHSIRPGTNVSNKPYSKAVFKTVKPVQSIKWNYNSGGAKSYIKDLQVSFVSTDYAPYAGQTYTPAADGTVTGMTSVPDYMEISTDTEGITIEADIIADTKKYIDREIATLTRAQMAFAANG